MVYAPMDGEGVVYYASLTTYYSYFTFNLTHFSPTVFLVSTFVCYINLSFNVDYKFCF